MLAWALRGILLAFAAAFAAAWPGLAARFGAAAAALLLLAVFLAILAAILALGYSVALRHASPRPAGVGPLTLRAVLEEYLALVFFFVLVLPFERLWLGPDEVGRLPAGKRPVLLVHGYMCNRGYWWWFRRRLRARGFPVATITLETPVSDIEYMAEQLDRRIADLLAETGAEQVDLVTHSMGGLVTRACLRRYGAGRVRRLVTLAGPHHGTYLAHLGIGRDARQMEPGNPWIVELNRNEAPPVPTLTIWSTGDEIVSPQDSSRLAGAREIVLPAMGHIAMSLSPAMLEAVAAELAS